MKETLLEYRINQVLLKIKWTTFALRCPFHTPQLDLLRRNTLTNLLKEYADLVKEQVSEMHNTRNTLTQIGASFTIRNGRFYITPTS
jgi:hypothetical protein